MITEAKFKYALMDMMKSLPLEEINVTALCEKCGCHRQTFYYHYTDIYDLIAAILFNEKLEELEKAKEEKAVIESFTKFITENFDFLRRTYNSAARDLTDDFIFGKLNAKLFLLWGKKYSKELSKNAIRNLSRRFSHFVSDEFVQCFKDPHLTKDKFSKAMSSFAPKALEHILPSMVALSISEEKK